MAYDEALASRVRLALRAEAGVVEKKMFGGLAFLVRGKMSVGIRGADLIVRMDPVEADEALSRAGVRVFDITGRPMKGWMIVSSEVLETDASLESWVDRSVTFVSALPAK